MSSRILIVDDTPANIQALAVTLKEKGYQISVATNGRQALEVVGRVRPDLILLDVMMPEMDGPTTFRNLQAHEDTRRIPVLLLTAKVQAVDQQRFADLGVAGVLFKPFDPLTLADQIAGALGW
jgi:CheY-like chemotaxis protein